MLCLREKVVLALLASDADNLFLTITVKELNPQVMVIATANQLKCLSWVKEALASRLTDRAGTLDAHDRGLPLLG